MAGRPHRSAGSPRHLGADASTPEVEQELLEVVPAARVQRSRLALAMAVTVAALPILVLDNFPATADPAGADDAVVVITTDEPSSSSTDQVTTTPSTEAPTSTEAAAPAVTEAPTSTTVAPTTTTTKAPVRTLVAARPTTTTTAAPPPTTEPAAYGDPNDPATWDRLAQCEADGNWAANTGNGYYGGLQFALSTWQHYGGTGYPHEAARETQIEVGQRVQAAKGWGAWPGCASKLGYS